MNKDIPPDPFSTLPESVQARIERETLRCAFLQLGDPIDREIAMFVSFVETNEESLIKYFSDAEEEIEAQLKANVPDDRFDDSAHIWAEEFGKSTHYCQVLLLVTMIESFLSRLANRVDSLFSDSSLTSELAEEKRKNRGSMLLPLLKFVTQKSTCDFQLSDDKLEPIADLLWTRNRIVHDGGICRFDASNDQAVLVDTGSSPKAKSVAQKAINRAREDLSAASRNLKIPGFRLSPADLFPSPSVEYELTITSEYVLAMAEVVREFVESVSEGFRAAVKRRIEEIHVGPRLVKN